MRRASFAKRLPKLLLRECVLLSCLYAGAVLLVRRGIPLAVGRLAPAFSAYFAPLREASVGWDAVCASILAVGGFCGGLCRRAWVRAVWDLPLLAFALCTVQINTIPCFRVVEAALALLGG